MFETLLRPDLAELSAYVPHPGAFAVRLDANEAPPLLSAEAQQALERAMMPETLARYPDARASELRAAIAARSGARPEEVLVGVGSDEVIAMLLTALDRPRPSNPAATMVTTTPTFVMYRISARVRGIKVIEVPLDATWDLHVDGLCRAIELARPNLVFIATPNNPTGNVMSEERLVAVIEAAKDALVIVDEAYVHYARSSHVELRRRYANVGVLGTLSKIGFAGLRVGWLIAHEGLVREVDKVRQPYNLCVPAQRGATYALRELGGEIERTVAVVVAERERLTRELVALGLEVTPSQANFLWVGTARPAREVFEALAARGVLVRSFHAAGGRLANRLRITVGTGADNDRLLEEMRQCL
jgi:histidinol-phosphate aminotransferase